MIDIEIMVDESVSRHDQNEIESRGTESVIEIVTIDTLNKEIEIVKEIKREIRIEVEMTKEGQIGIEVIGGIENEQKDQVEVTGEKIGQEVNLNLRVQVINIKRAKRTKKKRETKLT